MMGYFRKEKHTDEMGGKWWIYMPTVYKTGKDVVFVKGKQSTFVKKRRKR